MTPEERAKRAMFGDNAPFMDDDILTASQGYIINYPMFVAAIRDAVKAEREASDDMAKALDAMLRVIDVTDIDEAQRAIALGRAALAKARGLA